jgi:hypothetical protein
MLRILFPRSVQLSNCRQLGHTSIVYIIFPYLYVSYPVLHVLPQMVDAPPVHCGGQHALLEHDLRRRVVIGRDEERGGAERHELEPDVSLGLGVEQLAGKGDAHPALCV